MMKLFVDDSYEALSKRAANDLIEILRLLKNPLICTASGDSPAGLYKNIVDRVQNKQLDVSDWFFVGLDEWAGMNGSDEGSCRYHLDQQLFGPLQIRAERICFFDGRASYLNKECQRVEDFINEHNGIDVSILGLGMNGHVGMNEPGTAPNLHSHISDLHSTTKQVGQKYFTKEQVLTQGITLGLATLMESRHLMLLVSGAHKARIIQKVLEENVSEQLPGSLLRNHADFSVYLEPTSAQLLKQQLQKS